MAESEREQDMVQCTSLTHSDPVTPQVKVMLMKMVVGLGLGTTGARQGWVRVFETGKSNEFPLCGMSVTHVNGMSMDDTCITVGDMCLWKVCSVSETPTGPSQPLRIEALNPPIALMNREVRFIYISPYSDPLETPQPYDAPAFENICGGQCFTHNAQFQKMFYPVELDSGFASIMNNDPTSFGGVQELYTLAGTATFRLNTGNGGRMAFKGVSDPYYLDSIIRAIAPAESWDAAQVHESLHVHMAVVTMRLGRCLWAHPGCLFEQHLCAVLPEGTVIPSVLVDADISGAHMKLTCWEALYEMVGSPYEADDSEITASISVTIRGSICMRFAWRAHAKWSLALRDKLLRHTAVFGAAVQMCS